MDQSTENRIRERAYEIWSANGFVHGQADQHWLAAEREILAASTAALAGKPAPQKKRARRLTPHSTAQLHRPRTLLLGSRVDPCAGGAAARRFLPMSCRASPRCT